MIGTILNVTGILAGGLAGLVKKTPFSAAKQNLLKVALGALTVYCGLRLTWLSLDGSFLRVLKQLAIVIVALMLGNMTGRLLRLQKHSNRLGKFVQTRAEAAARPGHSNRFSDGFQVCAALFCAAPLGILGAIQDGLSGYFFPLAIKAVMDGLGTMGFVPIFGGGVLLSAIPVLVFQGTLTLLCARFLHPWLQAHSLVDPINAVGGLLVFCVALLIFEVRKIPVTDYLPSLLYGPLLAWWLRW